MPGWKPLIVCSDVVRDAVTNAVTQTLPACDFGTLILLINNIIYDLIFISSLLATAAFAYAGFKLLTSGGDEGALKDAKKIFTTTLKGFLWILVAWLLVYTITNGLLGANSGYSILGAPTK
jgi:hypothetical protein